jgi:hypothetical protein
VFVPVAESIRGFKEILEGKHDDVPERAFFLKGTIDDVVKEAGGAREQEKSSEDGGEGETGESSETAETGDEG